MKATLRALTALALAPVATMHAPAAVPARFQVHPLPGQTGFVFSMYGAPGELEKVKQLVGVMREQHLGNGFDPTPGPSPHAKPVFDYLASIGWPGICYSGSEMQIDGGRAVFGPEHAATLAGMDRAGVFNAIQLGEWGYHFHMLRPRESWWRDVYGKEFDQFKHLMKPAGPAGYERRPANRQECYDAVKAYFTHRSRDLLDRVCSVTGHSHYEAYVGAWGAKCIGLEVGENIAFTQTKFAFARGASRQWQKPWSVQVSPWFHGACTTSRPLRREGKNARGLDAGHSNGYMDKPWGILEPTTGDRQLRDLFDHQLFPGGDHIHTNAFPDNPEAGYLRPTPYGEMFDVQLTSASAGNQRKSNWKSSRAKADMSDLTLPSTRTTALKGKHANKMSCRTLTRRA